jgi:predicted ATPase
MNTPILRLTIEGYRSIRKLEDFDLRALNVLIGPNGAGKSNFVGFFRTLRALVEGKLQKRISVEGGADACLHFGPKVTAQLSAKLQFATDGYDYEFSLEPTVRNELVFSSELAHLRDQPVYAYEGKLLGSAGSGHFETRLREEPDRWQGALHAIPNWIVYHFHDTSNSAGVRRMRPINENEYLRLDAQNLAAFLYRVRQTNLQCYERIREIVRLAAPFFDDFKLRPVADQPHLIQLEWLQKDSDYTFLPSQLSDGTLRFICLATALLQPEPPVTMLFDEPELGLHPYALTLLGNLFQQYTGNQDPRHFSRQVIVSTQSALLLNEFAPEDVIVVDRSQGQSFFRRCEPAELSEWLKDYSMGELWQKNVLGGGPRNERTPEEALHS